MSRWWQKHFGDVGKQEAFGYLVWLTAGVVIAVPEAWSALGDGDAPWPTISGTIGEIEYRHPWAALVVVGVIVFVAYYALIGAVGSFSPSLLPAQGHLAGVEAGGALLLVGEVRLVVDNHTPERR